MKFDQYNISPDIKKNLRGLGFKRPTDIQFKSIPPIMNGEDVMAIAQTGTGKTAAFAIPIINKIHSQKSSRRSVGIKCIVLVPTRELAEQIGGVFGDAVSQFVPRHVVRRRVAFSEKHLRTVPVGVCQRAAGAAAMAHGRHQVRAGVIVAVTADVSMDNMEHAREAGFDGFIGKPLNPDRFPNQVRGILRGEAIWEPG